MREKEYDQTEVSTYVDTPRGIFTAAGIWFRTTEAMLAEYAGAVLDHEPLSTLLERAEVWLRSPQTLALWGLLAALPLIPPLPAALVAVTIYVGWSVLGPSFVNRVLARLLRVLDTVWVQVLGYVIGLSWIAEQGQYVALGVGLGGFILLRWGLVKMATAPLVRKLQRALYELPVPDQVLRGVLIQTALRHGSSLPELDAMERAIRERWSSSG